jgi:hypothetical protein
MANMDMEINVDQAWERFRERVKSEPVPEVWYRWDVDAVNRHIRDQAGGMKENTSGVEGQEVLPVYDSASDGDNVRAGWRKVARTRFLRRASVAAAALLVGGGLLGSPWGQQAVASAMRTFYVQHLHTISAQDMQKILNELSFVRGEDRSFDLKQYGSIEVTSRGKPPTGPITLAKAKSLSGYDLPSLPGVSEQDLSVEYIPGDQVTLRLKVAAVNKLIAQVGGKTGFPADVDGAPIVLNIPPQVRLQTLRGQHGDESLTVTRLPSVQVPQDVNLEQVRQALIGLPFLPSDVRQSLQGGDWTQTAFVPAGKNGKVVRVGNRDVLVNFGRGTRSAMWLANGYAYQLMGTEPRFPTEASLLSAVEAISK